LKRQKETMTHTTYRWQKMGGGRLLGSEMHTTTAEARTKQLGESLFPAVTNHLNDEKCDSFGLVKPISDGDRRVTEAIEEIRTKKIPEGYVSYLGMTAPASPFAEVGLRFDRTSEGFILSYCASNGALIEAPVASDSSDERALVWPIEFIASYYTEAQ
jgi:hypothetical protein